MNEDYGPIETVEYKGYQIKIFQDFNPGSPRDWDNLGEMICFHSRYNLGDKHSYTVDELKALVKRPDVLALPLYLYDHSGITMSTTPFSCPWDSGQVGYIIVTREKALDEWGRKKMSKDLRKRVFDVLRSEVEAYDQYLTGEVYGYEIETDDDELHSCWGFFGDPHDYMLSECKDIIDGYLIPEAKTKEQAMEVMR